LRSSAAARKMSGRLIKSSAVSANCAGGVELDGVLAA
jgi:hypothetical protein